MKVVDCPNSHPTTYFGFWQRECDLWCPGEKVPIPRWMFARMNREIERADLVVVQSKFCKESMELNGIPPEKVVVNPMGVDRTVFQKRSAVPGKPRFVNVGTICLRKGHQYLFRAFRIVKERLPEAELICVGRLQARFPPRTPQMGRRLYPLPAAQSCRASAAAPRLHRLCLSFAGRRHCARANRGPRLRPAPDWHP